MLRSKLQALVLRGRPSYRSYSPNLNYVAMSTTKPSVVIVGSGWAGFRAAQDIDKEKYDVSLVSPRNHFLFTPLLPSTAVGTLEFRCIEEPVRTIPGLHYHQAFCNSIDFKAKTLTCTSFYDGNQQFLKKYDTLIIAAGSETNTFGIAGIHNNPSVFFLKQLRDARSIRNKLIESFERAGEAYITPQERDRLLTFVVVGGGPTNVEFAAELHDFLIKDVTKWYPDLKSTIRVVIVEASGSIMGTFNRSLVQYVEKLFKKRKIEVLTGTQVVRIEGNVAILNNNTELSFGVMVWSTGIKQVAFIENIDKQIPRSHGGRLKVDDRLRLLSYISEDCVDYTSRDTHNAALSATTTKSQQIQSEQALEPVGDGSVYAIGDCAAHFTHPLPALAQVAAQQGKYIAQTLNKIYDNTIVSPTSLSTSSSTSTTEGSSSPIITLPTVIDVKPFKYAHLGSMASVGNWKGVIDTSAVENLKAVVPPVKGILAFLLWRAAYWTKQVSFVNKVLIPMYWFKAMIFGRDISRF